MDLDKLSIPWRIPCSLEFADCIGSEIIYITPTIRWASVINPGDFVELVNPYTFQPIETFAAISVKKTLLWMVDEKDLMGFPPADNISDLIDWMSIKYGIAINEYTPVVVLMLKRPDALDKAYELFMRPNKTSISGN